MISSQYNYYIPYKGGLLVFNGLTRKWVVLFIEEEKDAFEKILANPNMFFKDDNNIKLLQHLEHGGFIVENRELERQRVLDTIIKENNTKHGHLCILTTYDCNLKCWYCVQKHKKEYMTIETQEKTKIFIKRFMEEEQLESLRLSFFGGEPLMNADAIYNISSLTQELCKKKNIPFYNSITTNGTLIDEHLIEMFKRVKLTDFQITIDGSRNYHNKIKHSKEIRDSYKLVCSNIKQLLDSFPECDVTIRYNYTSKNLSLDVAKDLIDNFGKEYRKRVEFLPRQVWQEDESAIDESILKEIIDEIQRSGFRINKSIDIDYSQCYAESDYFFNIFHNGKIDKCGNILPAEAIGEILSDGKVSWHTPLTTVYKSIEEYGSLCIQCKYFPICMGPCQIRRRAALEANKPLKCLYVNPDKYFKQVILDYVESFE